MDLDDGTVLLYCGIALCLFVLFDDILLFDVLLFDVSDAQYVAER